MNKFCKLFIFFFLIMIPVEGFSSSLAVLKYDFDYAWKFYEKRTEAGDSPMARLNILDRIITKFDGKGIPALIKKAKDERNFVDSWLSYNKRKDAGATDDEKREILNKILDKYKNTHNDLTVVRNELDSLPKPDVPKVPEIAKSTVTVIVPVAPPPPEPPLEPKKEEKPKVKRAKYFGVSGMSLGGYGLYGYEMVVNYNRKYSMTYGQGSSSILISVPNSASKASEKSSLLLFRYSINNLYFGLGSISRTKTGTLNAGSVSKSATVKNSGIPLVIGVETGKKRGLFANLQWAFVNFSGDESVNLEATDPSSGEVEELKLRKPDVTSWFGLGIGVYFY